MGGATGVESQTANGPGTLLPTMVWCANIHACPLRTGTFYSLRHFKSYPAFFMQSADPQTEKSLASVVKAMRDGDAARAESICRNFLVVNAASIPHLQLLGHALVRQDKFDAAKKEIEFALKIAPDYARLYEELGNVQGLQRDYDEAIISFRRAVQLDPRLATAHKKLAQTLVAAGRDSEVDDAFEGFLDHDRDAALVAAGAEHWRGGRFEDAETTLLSALRKNPENIDAMRFLALVYRDQDKKLLDAEALLRRAVSIAPDFHQALGNLGRILVDNGKLADAIQVYEQLLILKPHDDDAWAGYGWALAQAGRVNDAAEAYRKSLEINAKAPGIHMARAHMLKTMGKQEEALEAYRKSIEYNPALGESYWSMANLKVFRFTDEEVSTMEQQLGSDDLKDDARVSFLFSLGKAYEDRKDYEKAWHHYDQGNQLKRSDVIYDPVENEQHLENIREAFSKELIQAHEGAGYDAPDPIFIVGLPRTGSTLVEQILASHSQVEGTAELPNLGAIANGTGKYRTDGLAYPKTITTLTQRDFASYGQEYLKQIARHRVLGTPFFIDKMPNNFIHVGWIKLILPNAKIINTRRHPMDSLLGVYKQLFARGQDFTYDTLELAEFYRCYINIMAHWNEVLPGQVLDVHYEDTVTDLESQVKRILDFCGLEFEESCLRYYETARPVKTASSEQVRQPIYRSALGLWQKYGDNLSEWQEELQDIIGDLPDSVREAAG
jgi:tetratricopeptide (TPR) repeat protein